jgi:DNA binding protein with HTH domain
MAIEGRATDPDAADDLLRPAWETTRTKRIATAPGAALGAAAEDLRRLAPGDLADRLWRIAPRGLREPARLETAAAKGRDVLAPADRRSRLPDALDALLRAPVLTPTALAARLKIVPQTATALLRELAAQGMVREVTGRGRFRAYAV